MLPKLSYNKITFIIIASALVVAQTALSLLFIKNYEKGLIEEIRLSSHDISQMIENACNSASKLIFTNSINIDKMLKKAQKKLENIEVGSSEFFEIFHKTEFYNTGIPVVWGFKVAGEGEKENHFKFKPTRIDPRNPKHEATSKVERLLLKKLQNSNQNEAWAIDEKENVFRFMRSAIIKKECLMCHGGEYDDPKRPGTVLDPIGFTKEGKKIGDKNGAFQIIFDLTQVQEKANLVLIETVIVGIFIWIAACIAMYIILKRTQAIESYKRHTKKQKQHLKEVKKEKASIEESEKWYRALFEQAANSVVLIDSQNGAVVAFNDKAHKNLGYTRDEFKKLNIHDFESFENGERIERDIEKSEDGSHTFEVKHIAKNAEIRNMIVSRRVVSISDKDFLLSIFIDITGRIKAERELTKRTKELKRSNEDLEQFAYIASHDLSEPLRMISSYVTLLGERYMGKLDPTADEFIEFAVDGTIRMQALIKGLLAYSRVGTDCKKDDIVDCNKVLKETLSNLKLAISENSATVNADNLPTIKGDYIQITQLFQNIISNALKFCRVEKPNIEIKVIEENKNWLFSFKDNGIGIDDKFSKDVFIVFRRLNTREEYSGTGIGLSICKKIVERHNGSIWVESDKGKGSTFYFKLPFINKYL